MNNSEEQVNEHKKMVIMSGKLSDFQLTNLKAWPFVVFQKGLEKVNIEYDFTETMGEDESLCAGWVKFDFEFDKEPKLSKEDLNFKLGQLGLWTKFMFWKDTRVLFTKKGKEWQI